MAPVALRDGEDFTYSIKMSIKYILLWLFVFLFYYWSNRLSLKERCSKRNTGVAIADLLLKILAALLFLVTIEENQFYVLCSKAQIHFNPNTKNMYKL